MDVQLARGSCGTAPDGAGERTFEDEEPEESPVLIAELPELPILRGLAGPAMLADTIVRRWQDHLPLHRLSLIYARDGVVLARSTMCGWHEQLADLAEPLVEAPGATSCAATRTSTTASPWTTCSPATRATSAGRLAAALT